MRGGGVCRSYGAGVRYKEDFGRETWGKEAAWETQAEMGA
jgi:hypothetical protein